MNTSLAFLIFGISMLLNSIVGFYIVYRVYSLSLNVQLHMTTAQTQQMMASSMAYSPEVESREKPVNKKRPVGFQ